MGMSTHVIGIRSIEDNSKHDKLKKVKISCDEAGISYPDEVKDYFGDALDVVPEHFEESIIENTLSVDLPLVEYTNDGQDGYELEVNDIPKDVKTIRFYNSY